MIEVKKGTLCVIMCPMLEDELLYSLSNDPDPKRIYLADVGPALTIKPKLAEKGLEYTLISESEFLNWTFDHDPEAYNVVIYSNDLGLHAEPKLLKAKVEEETMFMGNKADAIAFYYGLCGNALWDLKKWAESKVKAPVFVFTDCDGCVCDDCVGVAVGGSKRYLDLLKAHTGQLLITPAVASNWVPFISASEMMRGIGHNSIEEMRMIFELCGYKYGVMLESPIADPVRFKAEAQDVCDKMGLELLDGGPDWADLGPAKKIYSEAKAALPDA